MPRPSRLKRVLFRNTRVSEGRVVGANPIDSIDGVKVKKSGTRVLPKRNKDPKRYRHVVTLGRIRSR